MEIWQAVILGLVEGITEYLPVSSTGHLIIAASLMGLDEPGMKRAVDLYVIVIQGGAILAVLGLYWPRVLAMLRGLAGRDAVGLKLLVNLLIAFIPAVIAGLSLKGPIERYLFGPVPVLIALALGGILLVALTPWQRRHFHAADEGTDGARYIEMEALSWQRAVIIGLLQCVALWPGTSRSMMTIVGGMLVGLRPKQAAEFSFLLGLPTLGGACAYTIFKDVRPGGEALLQTLPAVALIVGIVVATVSAALAVRWLVGYLSRHGVAVFGWYRLGLCAALGVLWWLGVVAF
jgi:undecaprenyl-diphosphatase